MMAGSDSEISEGKYAPDVGSGYGYGVPMGGGKGGKSGKGSSTSDSSNSSARYVDGRVGWCSGFFIYIFCDGSLWFVVCDQRI